MRRLYDFDQARALQRIVRFAILGCVGFVFSPGGQSIQAADPSPAELEFFEKRIRPVLVDHCYECHSKESGETNGNLTVDSRAALLRGGDNGPAITPGEPDESFLLRVMRYEEDDYQMPPDGKLEDKVLADFEKWIEMGAPDPRQDTAPPRPTSSEIDLEAGRAFWSFRLPQRVPLPSVDRSDWPTGAVDRFILARLEAVGLEPSPPVDRRVLLRRLHYDLIGLPPTPEEIRRFLEDTSDNAWINAVDRLLGSPRFGERWGRHWLDVARYADSNGLDQNLTHYQAWRYRDYVLNSFNSDKPFDRFVAEQIAGDLLPFSNDATRTEQLIATGFLMVGPKQLSERDKEKLRMDVVDEQIDSVGKAFLGMTLGCARCHDHKFDPISMVDYYGLAGIFRSTRTIDGIKLNNAFVSGWNVRPLPIDPDHATALAAHEASVTGKQDRLKVAEKKLTEITMDDPSSRTLGIVVDDVDAAKVGSWKDSTYTPRYIGKGYLHDDREAKGKKSITFTPDLSEAGVYEIRLAYTPGGGRSTKVPVTIRYRDAAETILFDQRSEPPIDRLFKAIGRFEFDAGRQGSVTISNTGTEGSHVVADAVQFIPVSLLKGQVDVGNALQSEAAARNKEREQLQSEVSTLKAELKALEQDAPPPAPMAMAPSEVEKPGDYHILIRGNHDRLGQPVQRGLIEVALHSPRPVMPSDQSGRLELAEWISSRDNPLTARVFVNRVWLHLFGQGLVRSVDNFGRLGEAPSHPALLDYLAGEFMRRNWSVKQLIRELVLSNTYQQSVVTRPRGLEVDPENRLWWTARRRRMDAEVIRDSLLAISGSLDLTMGGNPVRTLGEQALNNESESPIAIHELRSRGVYLPILRSDLPPILAAFDFADPEMVSGRRETTTVPTQALFFMNSRFVADQADRLAESLVNRVDDVSLRIETLFQSVLGRSATAMEREAVLTFLRELEDAERDPVTSWSRVCQSLFAATEFRFVE